LINATEPLYYSNIEILPRNQNHKTKLKYVMCFYTAYNYY